MIVCLCKGISDCIVRQAISDGCQSLEAIETVCGAGLCCRACEEDLAQILAETKSRGNVNKK